MGLCWPKRPQGRTRAPSRKNPRSRPGSPSGEPCAAVGRACLNAR